jgi:hypothetical protein
MRYLRDKIRQETEARQARYTQFAGLVAKAREAGLKAAAEIMPRPMQVYEGNILVETVSEGVCGFGWVSVRPGTSSFAKWLVANRIGRPAYEGGIQIWISDHGQSYDRKVAHAAAYAKVLADAGIKAYGTGRLD